MPGGTAREGEFGLDNSWVSFCYCLRVLLTFLILAIDEKAGKNTLCYREMHATESGKLV